MTWQRFKGIVRWFLSNSIMWVLAIWGVVLGSHIAFNLFTFVTWLLFLGASFCIIMKVIAMATDIPMEIPVFPVPQWLDILTDVVTTGIVVAYGHWFYGILLALHTIMFYFFFKVDTPS